MSFITYLNFLSSALLFLSKNMVGYAKEGSLATALWKRDAEKNTFKVLEGLKYFKKVSIHYLMCMCVSEEGSILPAVAADEEQTFQPGWARHDFYFHRHLEYGLDTHNIDYYSRYL